MTSQPTVSTQALIDTLAERGVLENAEQTAAFIVSRQQQREMPLYLRVLVGIGAFVASFCFMGFLGVAGIISFDSSNELVFWGLMMIGVAIPLYRASYASTGTLGPSFLVQVSFFAMATGKTLFVLGVAMLLDSGWGVPIASLIVTAATYAFYRMSIDRFLSSLAVLTSLSANLLWNDMSDAMQIIWVNLFFAVQLVGVGWLMTNGRIRRAYAPIMYALLASLGFIIAMLANQHDFGQWDGQYIDLWAINGMMALSLIGLMSWLAGGAARLRHQPLVLASAGALVLGAVSAPGIVLAICLLVAGYGRHDRLLLISGVVMLPVFLILFYYSLDLNLAYKSAILGASGVLLLCGRVYLQWWQSNPETHHG